MSIDLALRPASVADAEALFAFEMANRHYFERFINSRGDAFYTPEAVAASLRTLEADREADRGYAFLVWRGPAVVARVNFTSVERKLFHSASLGYRVAESEAGRGVTSSAVAQAMALAFTDLRLWRVEATVAEFNRGSQRVLEKNGFQRFGLARRAFLQGGAWQDLAYYECHAEHDRWTKA
ncbi:GNAT family N-acetyltransferase [Chitinimonas sp.]|uniref:GNAT family N-acetyltransferase n=1 Tax=Chitinimonas sp. TaxID=1934313 RepID=UPI0035B4170C